MLTVFSDLSKKTKTAFGRLLFVCNPLVKK